MREIGIYGGTFAPVHLGHVRAVTSALASVPLDLLYVIPAGIPPHKRLTAGDDPGDRLAMLRIAFRDADPRVVVSDHEIRAAGTSYTALTLKHFAENGDHLTFFCGTDMFETLETWYRPDLVFSLARIVHLRRENCTGADLERFAALQKRYETVYGARILQLDAPPLVMSSTEVRRRAAAGLSLRGWVPDGVGDYILSHCLYGAPYTESALAEEVGRILGGGYRFAHTCGVVKECRRLAGLYGLNADETAELTVAAYLHDVTKPMKPEEHLDYLRAHGFPVGVTELRSPKTLHSLTGSIYARENFPALTGDRVYEAIRCHTTGKKGMTLFEKLLYLADYIEEGRTFPDCVALRSYFDRRVREEGASLTVLNDTLILSFDMTVKGLREENAFIHPDTAEARADLAACAETK